MSVLVIAEIVSGELILETTAKAVDAATNLGDITVLACGTQASAELVARIDGVKKVIYLDDLSLKHGLAEQLAPAIVSLNADYSHIVAAASTFGKNLLPRVAALLDVMVITDVTEIVNGSTFKRPVYAGNAIQTVVSNDAVKVLTIRASSYESPGLQAAGSIESFPFKSDNLLSSHVSNFITENERPELTSAKVVVSGGRALGSRENFALIEQLADSFDGAVGASRAAVDSGFAPNDWQVGQTGKIVAPDLYIACGISGAIQHLAGMKDSKFIVAINKDEEAPIFQIADIGLVADVFNVIPELVQTISLKDG